MQDNLTTEKLDRTYRGWFLENEYLKLMALPEIGGRLVELRSKKTGANHLLLDPAALKLSTAVLRNASDESPAFDRAAALTTSSSG